MRDKEKRKIWMSEYRKTEKYQKWLETYRKSEKYKKRMKIFRSSEKSKNAGIRYRKTEKWRILHKKRQEKYRENPSFLVRQKESDKKYRNRPEIKEKRNKYACVYSKLPERKEYNRKKAAERRKIPKNRIDSNFSRVINFALRGSKCGRKWEKIVGYGIEELMSHLESQFTSEMSWDNYGSYWWVDHIVPRSFFNYESSDDIEFKKCWSLSNLQPMEKISNIKKGNKLTFDAIRTLDPNHPLLTKD